MTAGHHNNKKKVILLFPYKYIGYDAYAMEIDQLQKEHNIRVEVHDLSFFLYGKIIDNAWIAKRYKKAIKFLSLFSWLNFFIRENKKNTIIYNFVPCDNFKTFLVNAVIRLSKTPIVVYSVFDCPEPVIKNNRRNFFIRFKKYGFNFFKFYHYINSTFYSKIIKFFKIEKLFILNLKKNIKNNYSSLRYVLINKRNLNPKNILVVNFHAEDFSKYLMKPKSKTKKKYIIYLDTPTPYFEGDAILSGQSVNKHVKNKLTTKEWYDQFNNFFNNLEFFYNAKVLVIPHPKTKGIVNPFFKQRIINHDMDAAVKFIPQCKLLLTTGSTGISHAIVNYKPFLYIYSPLVSLFYRYDWRYKNKLFAFAKIFKKRPINISSYTKKEISKNFKVNRKLYDNYKYKYLTEKKGPNSKIPNYKIMKNIINNYV